MTPPPTPRKPARSARGAFTLVEILVAVAVLTLGVLASALCLEATARAARAAAAAAAILALARSRAEELRPRTCDAAAAAGAADSADAHLAWQSRRVGPIAYLHVRAWRTPPTRASDSASASATRWCAP